MPPEQYDEYDLGQEWEEGYEEGLRDGKQQAYEEMLQKLENSKVKDLCELYQSVSDLFKPKPVAPLSDN